MLSSLLKNSKVDWPINKLKLSFIISSNHNSKIEIIELTSTTISFISSHSFNLNIVSDFNKSKSFCLYKFIYET